MTHLLKRAVLAFALVAGLACAAPALADCAPSTPPNTAGLTANSQLEVQRKTCEALQGISGLAASGVTSATTTLTSSTVWQPTFNYVPGRAFYLTLSGAGTGTVTIVYTRDNWSTYGPEVAAVDGSAPIILNKVAYAGSQVVFPLAVAESGVKVGLLPGTLTGTVTAAFSQ